MWLNAISQLVNRALVENDRQREHIQTMRKFHHNITIWGHRGSAGMKAGDYSSVSLPYVSTACKNIARHSSPYNSIAEGVRSITMFPDVTEILGRLEPNGVRADWLKVGCDLRRAMDVWTSGESESTSDREVA